MSLGLEHKDFVSTGERCEKIVEATLTVSILVNFKSVQLLLVQALANNFLTMM